MKRLFYLYNAIQFIGSIVILIGIMLDYPPISAVPALVKGLAFTVLLGSSFGALYNLTGIVVGQYEREADTKTPLPMEEAETGAIENHWKRF